MNVPQKPKQEKDAKKNPLPVSPETAEMAIPISCEELPVAEVIEIETIENFTHDTVLVAEFDDRAADLLKISAPSSQIIDSTSELLSDSVVTAAQDLAEMEKEIKKTPILKAPSKKDKPKMPPLSMDSGVHEEPSSIETMGLDFMNLPITRNQIKEIPQKTSNQSPLPPTIKSNKPNNSLRTETSTILHQNASQRQTPAKLQKPSNNYELGDSFFQNSLPEDQQVTEMLNNTSSAKTVITLPKLVSNSIRLPSTNDALLNEQTEQIPLNSMNSTASLEKYQNIKEIGRGGMGRVALWKDNHIQRLVAAKMLHANKNESLETVQRFWEEGQISGQLEHPNIVPIYDMGLNQNGQIYFIMKYVQGESLQSVLEKIKHEPELRQETWSLRRILQIFQTICYALEYAHTKQVIHRDLKPDNIMLGNFGEVLVMDWGLAKVIGQGQEILSKDGVSTLRSQGGFKTITGKIAGTPYYMSPEQAKGEIENLDQRSDIYSLGAILYEILTGYKVIDTTSVYSILHHVSEGKLRNIPKIGLWGKIPEELKGILKKTLSYKKEDRYQSARELAEDIQRFMDNRPVSVYHYSTVQKLTKFLVRIRKELTLIIASIFLATTAIGILEYFNKQNLAHNHLQNVEDSFKEQTIAIEKIDLEIKKILKQNQPNNQRPISGNWNEEEPQPLPPNKQNVNLLENPQIYNLYKIVKTDASKMSNTCHDLYEMNKCPGCQITLKNYQKKQIDIWKTFFDVAKKVNDRSGMDLAREQIKNLVTTTEYQKNYLKILKD